VILRQQMMPIVLNLRVTSIQFATYAKRGIFSSILCSVLLRIITGTMPGRDSLVKRIIYLRDFLKPPPREQLKELIGYLDNINNCPYRNDTTHIFLLRRIGDIYFRLADYIKSVQYRRQVIDTSMQMPTNHL
jgi:hypothetical protein